VLYQLIPLAPGSYDVILDGVVVASRVQARGDRLVWVAEVLLDLPISERPPPFKRDRGRMRANSMRPLAT
jgi:hypothetical protein